MFGPVVDVILPIFGLLMIGYITVMLGWFDQTAIKGLTRFVFDFAVPMLLLRTVANAQLPEHIPWDFLASYYLGTILILFSGLFMMNSLAPTIPDISSKFIASPMSMASPLL